MKSNPFIHIRSPKLRILPNEDEELVNEGMYGKSCALYLQTTLAKHGYSVPFVGCEDWGWWVEVAGLDFKCGVGVYGMQIGDTDELDLCVTVLTTKGKQWNWRKFRSIDTTTEVERLHQTIRNILDSDTEVTVIAETFDFPLG